MPYDVYGSEFKLMQSVKQLCVFVCVCVSLWRSANLSSIVKLTPEVETHTHTHTIPVNI